MPTFNFLSILITSLLIFFTHQKTELTKKKKSKNQFFTDFSKETLHQELELGRQSRQFQIMNSTSYIYKNICLLY